MHTRRTALILSAALALPLAAIAAQAHPAPPARPAAADAAPVLTDKDVAATQRQLIDLLKLSPTLTTVVAHDPSLLADQDYVARNNPQLADFLKAHPEVVRNPDYFLFTHLPPDAGGSDEALERAVWPDVYSQQYRRTGFDELLSDSPPLLAFVAFLIAAIWGIRVFIENRRWSRTFKLQSDVHGRLIDKFSTSQELAAYMETEAGRRFLEAAPIPVTVESPRIPSAVSRVLTPVQIGVVLILLGVGFLLLRHAGPDYETPMLVLGVLILMPGIGFILSAGITWVLATRLGLMPPPGPNHLNTPYSER
ncbi:MAG: hypothetical protein WBX09_01710 [Terracidiphilus sp.]